MEQDNEIIIREASAADACGIARVHVDAWLTTYAGIMPDAVLQSLSYERSEKQQRNFLAHPPPGNKTFVAELEPHGIVGFACGGNEREGHTVYKGELFAIYILEPNQRRGIGTMLVLRVVDYIKSLGLENMIVWVLEENPARLFYERLGGVVVDEKMMEKGGKQLKEIAYGWDDIHLLDYVP